MVLTELENISKWEHMKEKKSTATGSSSAGILSFIKVNFLTKFSIFNRINFLGFIALWSFSRCGNFEFASNNCTQFWLCGFLLPTGGTHSSPSKHCFALFTSIHCKHKGKFIFIIHFINYFIIFLGSFITRNSFGGHSFNRCFCSSKPIA